jgi:hypothetical protein
MTSLSNLCGRVLATSTSCCAAAVDQWLRASRDAPAATLTGVPPRARPAALLQATSYLVLFRILAVASI